MVSFAFRCSCVMLLQILLTWGLGVGHAQERFDIQHYSSSDGLSNNNVNSILKDKDGFMWFSTWAGINRFDGQNFVTYKSFPGDSSGLKNNRISQIVEDSAGFIWLYSYDKHIYRFNKNTNEFNSLSELTGDANLNGLLFKKILAVDASFVWLLGIKNEVYCLYQNGKLYQLKKFASGGLKVAKLSEGQHIFLFIDSRKNIWISTTKGLRVITKQPGNRYSSKSVLGTFGSTFTSITMAKDRVWLSTDDGFVFSTNTALNITEKIKVTSGRLNLIKVAKTGIVYCSSASGELICIDKFRKIKRIKITPDGSPLYHIFEDSKGILWIESEGFGVVRFDPLHEKRQLLLAKDQLYSRTRIKGYKIFEDRTGRVWAHSGAIGLRFYNAEKQSLELLEGAEESRAYRISDIKDIYYDPSGVLWLVKLRGGIGRVVFKSEGFRHFTVNANAKTFYENEVRGVHVGKTGLFLGTRSGQLYKINEQHNPVPINFDKPLGNSGIYCVIEDRRGRLWIGTKADGLYKAEPLNGGASYSISNYRHHPSQLNSISSNSIYSLYEDKRGRIWAGTFESGIVLLHQSKGKLTFSTTRNFFKNYPSINYERIRHISEDTLGRIWVGTTDGLLIISSITRSPENYQILRFNKERGNTSSLGGDDIQYIYRDSRSRMWVLTSGGLNLALSEKDSKTLQFKNYSIKDGLSNDYLLSCAEDLNGDLWIATQTGISQFDIKSARFQNYIPDGKKNVLFSEASCARMQNGDIVFGKSTGFLRLKPKEALYERIDAKLALTNFQINNEDVDIGQTSGLTAEINRLKKVVLKHDQNTIGFEFGVLDYRNLSKEAYAFRLVNYDDVWRHNNSQRRTTYTQLSPGTYTFEVKSLNDNLYTNLPFKSIRITILPPWWKSWWAMLFYVILSLLLLEIIRRIIRTILKLRQGIELEKRLSELKLHFLTQISHELRTPLTLIVNPVEEVLKKETLSVKGQSYMKTVSLNAQRMVRLVNQLLDLRKAQSGEARLKVIQTDLLSFIETILKYFDETILEKNLRFNSVSQVSSVNVWIDPEKIEIALFNVLANAIKFSPRNSTIEIKVKSSDAQTIFIEVVDEGDGVEENELEHIFKLYYEGQQKKNVKLKGTGIGLALSKELIELHSGKIYALNDAKKGLKVVIELKTGRAHLEKQSVQFCENEGTIEKNVLGEFKESVFITKVDSSLPILLLVEDNIELSQFLSSKLSEHYNVEMAYNGKQGWEMARMLLPNVVISDIMMPEMTGIELLDKLKNDELTSHIPIVLLTAMDAIETEIESLRYGADYYITKPFRMELLEAALGNLIAKRKQLFQKLIDGNQEEFSKEDIQLISERDKAFLEQVLMIIEEKLPNADFAIDNVPEIIGLSRSSFYRKLKALTDDSPVDLLRRMRLKKAKEFFNAGETNVSIVAYSIGFNSPKYFSVCFKNEYRMTPSEYLSKIRVS